MIKIGDLRRLIKEAGGSILIGEAKIKYNEGGDIDVFIGSSLVAWAHSSNGDEVPLDQITASTNGDFKKEAVQNLTEMVTEKDKEIVDLREKLERSEQDAKKNELAVGKVEAYEKLLIGRSVSIGE